MSADAATPAAPVCLVLERPEPDGDGIARRIERHLIAIGRNDLRGRVHPIDWVLSHHDHLALETLAETRVSYRAAFPFDGQELPDAVGAPELEDLLVPPPSTLEERTWRVPVEETRTIEECPGCEGAGRVTCGRCGGDGETTSGFGKDKKTSRCGRCAGSGNVQCSSCEGSGKVLELRIDEVRWEVHQDFDGDEAPPPYHLLHGAGATVEVIESDDLREEHLERLEPDLVEKARALVATADARDGTVRRQRLRVTYAPVLEVRYRLDPATRPDGEPDGPATEGRLWIVGTTEQVYAPGIRRTWMNLFIALVIVFALLNVMLVGFLLAAAVGVAFG